MPDELGAKKGAKKPTPEPEGLLVDAARAIGSALGTLAAKTSELATKIPVRPESKAASTQSPTSLASKPKRKKKKSAPSGSRKGAAKAKPGARKRAR